MLLENAADSDWGKEEVDSHQNPAVRLVLGSPILTRIKVDCEDIIQKKHPKKRYSSDRFICYIQNLNL